MIKPCLSKITEKTIPIAIVLVTYGKKKIVCNVFWNHLMEFKETAIISANKIDNGTVTNVINKVFGTAYLTKAVSLPICPAQDVYEEIPKIIPKFSKVNPSPVLVA